MRLQKWLTRFRDESGRRGLSRLGRLVPQVAFLGAALGKLTHAVTAYQSRDLEELEPPPDPRWLGELRRGLLAPPEPAKPGEFAYHGPRKTLDAFSGSDRVLVTFYPWVGVQAKPPDSPLRPQTWGLPVRARLHYPGTFLKGVYRLVPLPDASCRTDLLSHSYTTGVSWETLERLVREHGPSTGIAVVIEGTEIRYWKDGARVEDSEALELLLAARDRAELPAVALEAPLSPRMDFRTFEHVNGVICSSPADAAMALFKLGAEHTLVEMAENATEKVHTDTGGDSENSLLHFVGLEVEPAPERTILRLKRTTIDKTPLNLAMAHATGKEPLIASAECSVRLKPDDTGWVRVDVGSALAGTDVDAGMVARMLAGDPPHLAPETLLEVVGESYRFEVRARLVFERDEREIWMNRVPVRIEGNHLLLQTQFYQDQVWLKIEVVPAGNAAHQSAEACAAMVLARDRIAVALQVYPPRVP